MKIKAKYLRQIHIYCSLVCCSVLLLFSLTGITLNHQEVFESEPSYTSFTSDLAKVELSNIKALLLKKSIKIDDALIMALLSGQEVYHSTPGSRLSLLIEGNELKVEQENLGLISRLNELHQSRNASKSWKVISDVTAIAFALIALTGIWLSLRDLRKRNRYGITLLFSFIALIFVME